VAERRLASAVAAALVGVLALGGCASMDNADQEIRRSSGNLCRAEPGQRFLGQRNSAETGTAVLAATGASSLRWLAPGTIVTTEFAPDRVTVTYDEEFRIMQVSCG